MIEHEIRRDRAISAVEDAIASGMGIIRQDWRRWAQVEGRARDEIAAWAKAPRNPVNEIEKLLDDVRAAGAEIAEAKRAKEAVASVRMAHEVAQTARKTPKLDPDRVRLAIRCEDTRTLCWVTLPAA